jgi:DNA-binding LytR/AlgR family response regulator
LAQAIERARGPGDEDTGIEEAVRSAPPARFLGKRGNRYKVIPRKTVLYFSSEGGLTQLWTAEKYYWMEPALTELEDRLDDAGFFRISRQALVNLSLVEEVIPLIGGHGQVKLANGKVLDVSRRRMRPLIEQLEKG